MISVRMNIRCVIFLCLAMMSFLPILEAACARCRLSAGWGLAIKPASDFNPNAIATIKGEILSVQDVQPDQDVTAGIYVLVAVGDEQFPVRVAPVSYLKQAGVDLQPSDRIQVTGSQVDVEGHPAYIATEMQHTRGTLQLRSVKGIAVWSGKLD